MKRDRAVGKVQREKEGVCVEKKKEGGSVWRERKRVYVQKKEGMCGERLGGKGVERERGREGVCGERQLGDREREEGVLGEREKGISA